VKVLIFTEGGSGIGFGHITRCTALYEAFEEQRIIPALIINSDRSAGNILKGKEYKILNWLQEVDMVKSLIRDADITVIDSYLAGADFYKRISQKSRLCVYLDDNKRINYPEGIVINGGIHAGELAYPRKKGVVYLLGARYAPLRKEFWEIGQKKVHKNLNDILLTFGGFKKDFIIRLTEFLLKNFNYTLHLVFGEKTVFRKDSSVFVYNNVVARRMKDIMLAADVCISGGGQTAYELASCGTPGIGICFADNQLFSLKNLSKAGSLHFAGWHYDKDLFEKISGMLKGLDYHKRIEMSKAGRSLVNGKGARKIINYIINAYRP
jgi:spore coat polysaccharide biosynthesis predicted glycosyltransferase SpsG